MGSQTVSAVLGVLALGLVNGCGNSVSPTVSAFSAPLDPPDLSLQGVAFARLSEGQVVARGTADRVDYRRAGGRVQASRGGGMVYPLPGSSLAQFGTVRFVAKEIEGEVPSRRGVASGGVRVDTTRGDVAVTDRVQCDGDLLHNDVPVAVRGPGYQVDGNGFLARTDGSAIQLTQGVRGQLQMEARR